jgi:hypothetical protein
MRGPPGDYRLPSVRKQSDDRAAAAILRTGAPLIGLGVTAVSQLVGTSCPNAMDGDRLQ